MDDRHPMEARRCKAKARSSGGRCKRPAIPGGFVCRVHGGASPWAKHKAQERLDDLIDPDRALREAARVAYSDIRELYDEKGRLKPMKDWPDGAAAAVLSTETVRGNLDKGDGHLDSVVRVRLADKLKALEMLFKNMGLLTERLDLKGGIEIKWQD